MLWTVAATALVAGLLIGVTGIGGVLIVPVLTQLAGVPLDRAVASSLLGLLIAAIYAAAVHLRRERLPLQPVVVLCLCAAAGAVAGAASLDAVPSRAIRLLIALLCLGSGAHVLLSRSTSRNTPLSTVALGVIGAAVGYLSALSGTGGPVTLIPLLLALGTPAGSAVALGLAAQVPITLSATAVYATQGRVDPVLGATLGVMLLGGTIAGARLSRRLSGPALANAVATTLIAVGVWYGYATLS